MATSHLMTGKHIPHFGIISVISTLSFGEIFSYFATSWKWYCLTFWIGKKWRLFRRFFQYSVICHFSKLIIPVINKICKSRVWFNTDWIGRRDVVLPINHNNYNFPQKLKFHLKKSSQESFLNTMIKNMENSLKNGC